MNRRNPVLASIIALSLSIVAGRLPAATLFSSDFSSSTLNSNLLDTTAGSPSFTIDSGSIHLIAGNPNALGNSRAYIRTVDSDYLNFTYTLQYTNANNSLSFIGIGAGTNGGPSNEPGGGSLNLRLHSPGVSGGATNIAFNGGNVATLAAITTVGTHEVVITRIGSLVTFSIDNLPGNTATIDLSLPANAAINTAIGSGSKLFFGAAQDFIRFDNLSITAVPEPTSVILCGTATIGLFLFGRRRRSFNR
jgi:hypothetical protein